MTQATVMSSANLRLLVKDIPCNRESLLNLPVHLSYSGFV